MRPELLKKTFYLKSELSELAIKLTEEISKEEVLAHWKKYQPSPKYKYVIAEDGSFNKIHYLGFYLYSVSGYAVGFRKDGDYDEDVTGEVGLSVIKRTDLTDQYIKMLMFLCELKALLRLSFKVRPEILIIDGTLSGRFITVFPKADWFTSEEFEGKVSETAGELINDLKENLYTSDITAFSKIIKEKVFYNLIKKLGEKGKRKDIFEATLAKLAYFEYLLLLHSLFYELSWNPVVIGLAKSSHSTEIFKKTIPDLRIFHQIITSMGFSVPELYVNLDELKWEFSEYFEKNIAQKLKEVSIKYFYGKYGKGNTISLIEVYENPEKEQISPEYILDILSFYSVSGYPFLLKKADNEVRITNKDMELIEELLGLKKEIRGREGLE